MLYITVSHQPRQSMTLARWFTSFLWQLFRVHLFCPPPVFGFAVMLVPYQTFHKHLHHHFPTETLKIVGLLLFILHTPFLPCNFQWQRSAAQRLVLWYFQYYWLVTVCLRCEQSERTIYSIDTCGFVVLSKIFSIHESVSRVGLHSRLTDVKDINWSSNYVTIARDYMYVGTTNN